VVFLDEPMSGLDPIGRREVHDIMVRLRDRGTTVFFSSHILADAEAICTSVGIVSGGRLAASGRVADLVSIETRGWEVIVTGLSGALSAQLAAEGASVQPVGVDRHAVTLPVGTAPESLLVRLRAGGGALVSVSAVRETLEDVFLARVRATAADGDGGRSVR
jgi:ABC-2 type transport system ATP-binding protein